MLPEALLGIAVIDSNESNILTITSSSQIGHLGWPILHPYARELEYRRWAPIISAAVSSSPRALLMTIPRTQFATRPVFVYLKLMPDLRIYILCLISYVEGMFPSTSTVLRPAVGCSSFFGTT